jgi:hypothetical protein
MREAFMLAVVPLGFNVNAGPNGGFQDGETARAFLVWQAAAAAEREACAKVCEDAPLIDIVAFAAGNQYGSEGCNAAELTKRMCAAAIRNRKEPA